MENSFDHLYDLAGVCLDRWDQRTAEYERRDGASAKVMQEIQEERHVLRELVNHLSLHSARALDSVIRQALADGEVGEVVLFIRLRANKGNLYKAKIDLTS